MADTLPDRPLPLLAASCIGISLPPPTEAPRARAPRCSAALLHSIALIVCSRTDLNLDCQHTLPHAVAQAPYSMPLPTSLAPLPWCSRVGHCQQELAAVPAAQRPLDVLLDLETRLPSECHTQQLESLLTAKAVRHSTRAGQSRKRRLQPQTAKRCCAA